MPAVVVPALITAGIAASSALPWLAATAFIKSFAISMVIGGLSRALAPKPKKPALGSLGVSSNTFAIRQPAEQRKHCYGHTRISDVYAHMVGETNAKMHMILILCNDEIEAIDEIWVNDYAIPADWIDANGDVTQGRYSGKMRLRKHLGSPTQTADTVAVAELSEWTTNHRLQGIAYIYITLTKDQDIYPNGVPNFSAIVRGKKILDTRTSITKFTSNVALFAYDYLSQAEYGFQTSDVSTTNISAQANICDEIVTTADIDVNVSSIDTSTNIITLAGDINKFQWGDRVEVGGSVIPSGLSAATAYYVIIYQVKDTPRIKLATTLDNAFSNTAIDITSSGTSVVVTKTGEPRYHGAGVLETENTLEDNLWSFCNSMAGRAYFTGGEWKIRAGAYVAPDVEFTESDIIGGMNVRAKIPLNERFNVVKGLYVTSINAYQPDDYPVTKIQTYIDNDKGVEYPRELNLPFTNRFTTCQRIAKIELEKSRQEFVFTAPFNMKGALVQVGDTVEITIARYGFAQKEFEVTGFAFNVGENGTLSTNLTLRETAEAVYTWSDSEDASVDPAPNTTLPSAFLVAVPQSVAYNSRAVTTVGGDTVYNLVLEWVVPSDGFVANGGQYEVQFKESTEADWRNSFFVAGGATFTDIPSTSPNVEYDLRIRSVNIYGVRSSWVTIEEAIIGSSGGVVSSFDWGSVADSPSSYNDWGSVADTPTSFEDWGSVV